MDRILLKFTLPLMINILLILCFIVCPSLSQAEILSHESNTQFLEPQRALPYFRAGEGIIEQEEILQQYNLIDEMDVYALSDYAKLLLMPHMVDYRVYASFEDGVVDSSDVDWQGIALAASEKHGLEVNLILAVIRAESNFIADAISHVGAQGAMQIMPETARELGLAEPFNPSQNVDAGTRYLKEQIERFGSIELALAAYNAGPGNVIKYNGIPPFTETQEFVARVLSFL